MVNGGRHDSWNTARAPGMGMSYMTRNDLPYYYTLYDAFTAGDQYHQSTFTCTNPNRMHLVSLPQHTPRAARRATLTEFSALRRR
jgi:phospholipase C